MNGVVAKLIDTAVAEATAPLLVELAEAKVLLQKRDDEVAVYVEEIGQLRADLGRWERLADERLLMYDDLMEELETEKAACCKALDRWTYAKEEIARLKSAMVWVGEVYPRNVDCDGARVEMTWDEFNLMRECSGLERLEKRDRKALRASVTHTLRSTIAKLTAERDRLQWAAEEHFAELEKIGE